MKKEKNIYLFINNYILTFCCVAILLCITQLIEESFIIIPYILIICGIINIISVYKKRKLLMTPISIFSFIWLILIPISSFEYPVMREMTSFEWKIVLIFILCFTIGGICASLNSGKEKVERKKLTKTTKDINFVVLICSSLAMIIMFYRFGGIPLFYKDANISKTLFRQGLLFNMLSYFGASSILIYILDDPNNLKSKKVIIASIMYLILLILSGERFYVTILIILCIYIFCKYKVDFKLLKKILIAICSVLLIFLFILQYRGNESQKQKYFIDSGIYLGTAAELTRTEIFRYMGMQERLLTKTFEDIDPYYTKGSLALAPILKIFGVEPIKIPDIQIYGYTSKSIITKVYCDFGNFWWLAIIILSIIINISYINFDRKNSLISQYFALIWLVFLTFSFYAYFDSLVIFYLHFPIYIIIIEMLNLIEKR